jgi:hypothetical protein
MNNGSSQQPVPLSSRGWVYGVFFFCEMDKAPDKPRRTPQGSRDPQNRKRFAFLLSISRIKKRHDGRATFEMAVTRSRQACPGASAAVAKGPGGAHRLHCQVNCFLGLWRFLLFFLRAQHGSCGKRIDHAQKRPCVDLNGRKHGKNEARRTFLGANMVYAGLDSPMWGTLRRAPPLKRHCLRPTWSV